MHPSKMHVYTGYFVPKGMVNFITDTNAGIIDNCKYVVRPSSKAYILFDLPFPLASFFCRVINSGTKCHYPDASGFFEQKVSSMMR